MRTRAYSYQQHGLAPPTTGAHLALTAPAGNVWTWGNERARPGHQNLPSFAWWSFSAATWTTRIFGSKARTLVSGY